MTFDEALKELDECTDDFDVVDATQLVKKLRETYAPTVEMTKVQYDTFNSALKSSKKYENDFILFMDNLDTHSKFNCGTFENELFTFRNDSRYFMQAWLHPECIKVVDDE